MPDARSTAVDVIRKAAAQAAFANILLANALPSLADGRERAFATELTNGCLRNLIYLDYVIDAASSTPTAKMKPVILAILRAGAYQLLFMGKVPASAAINEAVKLAKKRGFGGLAGFVNAVLRNIAKNGKAGFPLPNAEEEPLRRLSVEFSMPMWIVETIARQRGVAQTAAFCAASAETPKVSLCANTLKTTRDALAQALLSEGAEVEKSAAHGDFLYVKGAGGPASLPPFADGRCHAMDENAATAVDLLNPLPGDDVLDMCAAPGGKAFYAAYKMRNAGKVTAWDINPKKAALIAEGAERLGLTVIRAEAADAASPPENAGLFKKVLLDAPCSGLGVLRRKPDIKHSLKQVDLPRIADKQRGLLANAAKLCAAGGMLVYCTCTVNADENENNAAWFSREFPFRIVKEEQTLPGDGGDGFYTALFLKEE